MGELLERSGYFTPFLPRFTRAANTNRPRLLELWLGSVPQYAVLFCRMVILAALADTLTTGLGAANQAVGKIRNFTLAVYTIKICT